jgi:CDP-paratose 2-epimerase
VTPPAQFPTFGLAEDFTPGDTTSVLLCADRLRRLGLAHLRTAIPPDASQDWLTWLFTTLGDAAEILPALPAGRQFARLLEAVMTCAGSAADAIELTLKTPLTADPDALPPAARAIQQTGRTPILGLDAGADLHGLGAHHILQAFDVIGLHAAPLTQAWRQTVHRAITHYHPSAKLWLTDLSHPATDDAAPARACAQAVNLTSGRLYWRGLQEPSLLARLIPQGAAQLTATLANPAPAILATRPVLVTGGAGFIGANLADRLAGNSENVLIYDALARPGVERNLAWLKRRHPGRIAVAIADLRDETALTEAASSASAVFHLAAQVAVTTSLVAPVQDFDINVRGTLMLLEALRRGNPDAPLIFASTNKVYGDLADIPLTRRGDQYLPEDAQLRARGIGETRPLCFHTPYGCSKGAADQYVLDYAHSFGLRTAVLRMSCIYGERQLGTEDQGWLAHFLLRAIAGEPITIYGDGSQVRDVLHIDDAVETYLAARANIDKIVGHAFNLGGGPGNAISLLQLIDHIEHLLGRRVVLSFEPWRAGDQRYFVADATAVRDRLALRPPLPWREGVARLAAHFGARHAEQDPTFGNGDAPDDTIPVAAMTEAAL